MAKSITATLVKFFGVPDACQLEIAGDSYNKTVSVGEAFVLSYDLSPHNLVFNVYDQSDLIGRSNISFDRIIEVKDLWVRCKTLTEKVNDIRFKINVQVEIKQQSDAKCPYLSLLASGKADNILSQLGRPDLIVDKSLKINFEPDAPVRLGAEVKVYEADSLSDLDAARLESIGGDQIKKKVKILVEETKKLGQNSLESHREELKHQVAGRISQQEEFELFTNEAIKEVTQIITQMCEVESERNQKIQLILTEQENARKNQTEIDCLKGKQGDVNREILILRAQRLRFKDLENLLESSQKFYNQNLELKNSLHQKFQTSQSSAETIRKNSETVKQNLQNEILFYQNKLKTISETEEGLVARNHSLKSQISELKVKIPDKIPETPSTDASSERYSKLDELNNLSSASFQHDQESKLKIKSSVQSKQTSYEALLSLYQSLEGLHQNTIEKHLDIYLNSNELVYLEQTCCIQGDLKNLTESLSKLPKLHLSSHKSGLKQLEASSIYLLKETDKIKDQCLKINEIIDTVLQKDLESDKVKNTMGEIKLRHPPFIPKLDDPIDVALFEYIKSCEMPIPIPFTREEPGVYLFGTKRIFIKLENGNISIRIGGGYTSIRNFIEIYTPIELERQEEAVEEAFPQHKSTLGRFNSSPQKGMSPQRAARIIQTSVEAQVNGTIIRSSTGFRKTPIKK